jgi:anti-sigma factor RsiW
MMTRINPSDWETLSAYLDNELSARERTQLETRLKKEPDLGQALNELRQVRNTLRSQPRLRAPRNFTLTPQMAGVRPGARPGGLFLPPAYPVLRLASVLATIFFVLISAGSFYVRSYAPQPREVSMAQQDVPQNAPAIGMGGGGGAVEPPSAPMSAARTAPEQATAEASSSMTLEAPDAQVLEVTPLTENQANPEEEPSAQAALPNMKLPPGPQSGNPVQDPAAAQQQAANQALAWKLGWTVLIIVQALLAILAIGAGAAALYLRQSARR